MWSCWSPPAEAGKDAVALISDVAADLPPGTVLVVVHSGGGRAKALADKLKNLGAQVHPCARITKFAERADFVRREFRALKVKVSDDTVTALLDAVGSDIRDLASVCSQLVADTDGEVDAAAVRRYHSGKAEVKGFDIADKAVVGDVAGAAEALRWAMLSGEPQVVLADALAEAVHTIARVAPLSGRPVPAGVRAGYAAMAGAEGAEAGETVVARVGRRGDAPCRSAERGRQGSRCGRRLRAGVSGAKGRRARPGLSGLRRIRSC